MLLGLDILDAISPIGILSHLGFERLHDKSLVAAHTRADVGTVAATEAVEHVDLLTEVHALHGGGSLHFKRRCGEAFHFLFVHHERTDGCVRADICTLVTLDTVLGNPLGNECGDTALLVSGRTLFPRAIDRHFECRNGQQVAVLGIDGTYKVADVDGFVTLHLGIGRQTGPCGINGQLLVFATTVNSLIVLIDDILAFLSV